MKKVFKAYLIIWAILFVVFNVICFATPGSAGELKKYAGAFWSGYIFISIAFFGQLVCAYMALNTSSKTKLFYNIPIIRVSYTGLILTLVFGALCMAIPNLPNWVGIIVCLLVLAFTAIAVVKATVVADAVESIDAKIKNQTFFIKSLTIDANSLMASAPNSVIKEECRKIYEAIRFSDPMSNDELISVENHISQEFKVLSEAVRANDIEKVSTSAKDFMILLENRNQKCKLLK